MRRSIALCALVAVVLAGSTRLLSQKPGPSPTQSSVYIEELTWVEIRDAIKAGKTTAIIPTGGTEQSGPHLVVGKESYMVHYCAGEIARRLGNALVARTLAYVPEGNVDPPSGSMRYPGSLTLPEPLFVDVLVWAGRSLKVNGFTNVVLIGNNSGNQSGLKKATEQLNKEWAGSGTRALFGNEYHDATSTPASGTPPPFQGWLISQGEKPTEIGSHAGIRDSSTLMAVEALAYSRGKLIRWDKLAPGGGFEGSGVSGNPTKASVVYGKHGVEMKIDAAVKQIKAFAVSK